MEISQIINSRLPSSEYSDFLASPPSPEKQANSKLIFKIKNYEKNNINAQLSTTLGRAAGEIIEARTSHGNQCFYSTLENRYYVQKDETIDYWHRIVASFNAKRELAKYMLPPIKNP